MVGTYHNHILLSKRDSLQDVIKEQFVYKDSKRLIMGCSPVIDIV